jgi:hypothetical protein
MRASTEAENISRVRQAVRTVTASHGVAGAAAAMSTPSVRAIIAW